MTIDNFDDMTMDNFGESFRSINLPDLPDAFENEVEAIVNAAPPIVNEVNAARSDEATHPDDGRLFNDLDADTAIENSPAPSDEAPIIQMDVSDDNFQVLPEHDVQLPNQVNEEGLGDVNQGELADQPPPPLPKYP